MKNKTTQVYLIVNILVDSNAAVDFWVGLSLSHTHIYL